LAKVHAEKALLAHWMEEGGALLEMGDKRFKIGLPEASSAARSYMLAAATKKYLEQTAAEVAGRPLALDVVLDPSLKIPEHSETPPEPAAPAATPAKPVPAPAPTKAAPPPTNEDLHEPLIQAAMEKFKASLVTS
jgi:hypothetical protein